ncbi:MAG: BrnT family toxin [Geminicoccaceae bacterium]|nr:BrnT family toxin [Geminicoccaceae bacterium]
MPFEYDPNKSKHGIDFKEAQALWEDGRLLEAPARTDDEPRFLMIGKIGDKHWSVVCVRRGDNLRIISVRRVRTQEIERYESG